jgi:hypothetical protein
MAELYFSLDIETDGPIPIFYSMRSIGIVAFLETDEGFTTVGRFYAKLDPFPGAKIDLRTLNWWFETPERQATWNELLENTVDPEWATIACIEWIEELARRYDRRPVCVASPAGYDFTFLRVYMVYYRKGKETPFKHRCLDLRSLIMAWSGEPYLKSGRETLPAHMRSEKPYRHIAVEDAEAQGEEFMTVLDALRSGLQTASGRLPSSEIGNQPVLVSKGGL